MSGFKRLLLTQLKKITMFLLLRFLILYALDNNFPNFSDSQKQTDVYKKVAALKQAFKEDIIKENTSFASRFFPYIQPYEFEGYYL